MYSLTRVYKTHSPWSINAFSIHQIRSSHQIRHFRSSFETSRHSSLLLCRQQNKPSSPLDLKPLNAHIQSTTKPNHPNQIKSNNHNGQHACSPPCSQDTLHLHHRLPPCLHRRLIGTFHCFHRNNPQRLH